MTVFRSGGSHTRGPLPLWRSFPDAFSETECAGLIGIMSNRPMKSAGLVGGHTEAAIRQTEIHWLSETEETAWVYARLMEIAACANRETFHFNLTGVDEDIQIGRYSDGAFYDWHVDRGGRGAGRLRKLSISVQLSPHHAYEGGDLELNPDGHAVQAPRTRGTAIVFPSYVLHRVKAVTRGVRHSLVTWIHGPDFM